MNTQRIPAQPHTEADKGVDAIEVVDIAEGALMIFRVQGWCSIGVVGDSCHKEGGAGPSC